MASKRKQQAFVFGGFLLAAIAGLLALWLSQSGRTGAPRPPAADGGTPELSAGPVAGELDPGSDAAPGFTRVAVEMRALGAERAPDRAGVWAVAVDADEALVAAVELRAYRLTDTPGIAPPVAHAISSADQPTFLGDLPTGRYRLRSARGHDAYFRHEHGAHTPVRLSLAGRDVAGLVIDADGRPFAGAAIAIERIGDRSLATIGVSGADGRFVLRSIRDRSVLRALAAGHTPSAPVVIRYDSTAAIRVREAAGPANTFRNFPCDANGGYAIGPLPAGRYLLACVIPSAPPTRIGAFDLQPGEDLDLGTFVPPRTGSYQVVVQGPIAGHASLSLVAGSVRIVLDRDGASFRATDVPAGAYELVTGGQLPPLRREVVVRAGAEERDTLEVTDAKSIELTILAPERRDEHHFRMRIRGANGRVLRETSGKYAGGLRMVLPLVLFPGRYEIALEVSGGLSARRAIVVGNRARRFVIKLR